ncbi:hypothetical protein EVAR_33148_1 [Eumeta japonica]|uniref:Uncharacterized protein n=1 Tax=Eumeta variegata TaxID=151549 RepID=A0A4C1ZVQ0_EUMVA|nr:hypothetical protein EVAR_33148_1 [Eumeta japonica]
MTHDPSMLSSPIFSPYYAPLASHSVVPIHSRFSTDFRELRARAATLIKRVRGKDGSHSKNIEVLQCCARGRPIIVEWERDARHSAGLSRSVTHRYVTERYTFHK